LVASQTNSVFWKEILKNYKLRANARRSLNELRGMGLKLAVVSNHRNPEALKRSEY
jgi:FMN phosphatase YigB (HAD superfamily)